MLDDSDLTNGGADQLNSLKAKERVLVSLDLVVVIVLAIFDSFEDAGQGVGAWLDIKPLRSARV